MLANRVVHRDHRGAIWLALVILISLTMVGLARTADAAATDVEQCFLDEINQARADVGASPLAWAPDVEQYTRDHSVDMSGWGELIHSTGSQLGAAIPSGWTSWGENIGWQSHPDLPDCTAMHNAFMASTGHRNNLLNANFEFAATGTYVDGSGELWTTHVFFSHPTYAPTFNGSFADDDGSVFEVEIEKIAEAGITAGCGGDNYCPGESVTRGQMAAFINRALGLPSGGDAGFVDVTGTFEADINAIAAAGITTGCSPNRYCPGDSLTRAQMAAFIARAFDLPPAPSAGFSDTNGHMFEDEINQLAAAGITLGCGNGEYCPDGIVSRGQMAAFLARALGL